MKQIMDREQMRMAILNQEQIFRQQGLKIEHFICLQSAQYAEFSLHLNSTRSAQFLTTLLVPTESFNQVQELQRLYHVQKQLMQ